MRVGQVIKTVIMPSSKLLSSNKTAQILLAAEEGGYGVLAAIAYVDPKTMTSPEIMLIPTDTTSNRYWD